MNATLRSRLALIALAAAGFTSIATSSVDNTCRAYDSATFALDATHPSAVRHVTLKVTPQALPDWLPSGGMTVRVTIEAPAGVNLSFVSDATGTVVPGFTTGAAGSIDVPLEPCELTRACERSFRAVLELEHPTPTAVNVAWNLEARVTYPDGSPPDGADIDVIAATEPWNPGVGVHGAFDDRVVGIAEVTQHVTMEADALALSAGGTWPAVARGRLTLRPATGSEAEPLDVSEHAEQPRGMWVRITPDDGGAPVLDGPVFTGYVATLPAVGEFPILTDCAPGTACRRGYWVQILVFGYSQPDVRDGSFLPYAWSVSASILAAPTPSTQAVSPGSRAAAGDDRSSSGGQLTLTVDEAPPGITPPGSLFQQGTIQSFHVDPDHRASTLAMTLDVDASAVPAAGRDPRSDALLWFTLQTRPDYGGTALAERWLSGRFVGDWEDPEGERDDSGWSGPGWGGIPGNPLTSCAGKVDACTARIGLAVHLYDTAGSGFDDEQPIERSFTVDWSWMAVGLPAGTTLTAASVAGEGLPAVAGWTLGLRPTLLIICAAGCVAAAVAFAGLRILAVRLAGRSSDPRSTGGVPWGVPDGLPGITAFALSLALFAVCGVLVGTQLYGRGDVGPNRLADGPTHLLAAVAMAGIGAMVGTIAPRRSGWGCMVGGAVLGGLIGSASVDFRDAVLPEIPTFVFLLKLSVIGAAAGSVGWVGAWAFRGGAGAPEPAVADAAIGQDVDPAEPRADDGAAAAGDGGPETASRPDATP